MSDVARAEARRIHAPPPPGSLQSVALEGSGTAGRSQVYRHWRFKDGLLHSLDPKVKLLTLPLHP